MIAQEIANAMRGGAYVIRHPRVNAETECVIVLADNQRESISEWETAQASRLIDFPVYARADVQDRTFWYAHVDFAARIQSFGYIGGMERS